MSLQRRGLLVIMSLIALAIIPTTIIFTINTRNVLIDQRRSEGLIVASLVAESASFIEGIPQEVEDVIGEQMIVQARIAAHLIDAAEDAGEDVDTINQRLIDIVDTTILDEFWITDETGESYLRSRTDVEFTFSDDPERQPQAVAFWPLLQNQTDSVIQEVMIREIDDQPFKYAGVNGIDQPRIVQVGYNAAFLDQLEARLGLPQLINRVVLSEDISAVWVVDRDTNLIASSLAFNADPTLNIDTADLAELEEVMTRIETRNVIQGDVLRVMRPIVGENGNVVGAVLVYLSLENLRTATLNSLFIAGGVVLTVLVIAFFISRFMTRWVIQSITTLDAAAQAVAEQNWSHTIDSNRQDELGRLIRSFNYMTRALKETYETLESTVAERTSELQAVTQNNFQLSNDLELAYSSANLVTSTDETETILQTLLEMIRERYHFYVASIFEIQDDEIVMKFAVMDDGRTLTKGFDNISTQAKTSAIALAARLGEPVNIDDVSQSTVYLKHPLFPDTVAEFCLPLVVGETIVGVLDLQSSSPRSIDTDTMTVLQTLSRQIALVLRITTLRSESANLRTHTQEVNALRLQQMTDMANDVRKPVYGMLEFADFMLQGVYGTMNANQSAAVNHLIANGDHLLEQINTMLGVSQLEIDNKRFFIESVDIKPVIQAIYRQVREIMNEHPVTMKLNLGDNLQPVWADQRQLRLILLQLLTTMMLSKDGGEVEMDVNPITDSVRIDINDMEASLSDDDVANVGRSTVVEAVNSLVLVMRNAKDVIEAQGGKFTVEGKNGGTIISITLLMSAIATTPSN